MLSEFFLCMNLIFNCTVTIVFTMIDGSLIFPEDAVFMFENQGYDTSDYRVRIVSDSGEAPSYGDSFEEAWDKELDSLTVSVEFDVTPEGYDNEDAFVTVKYDAVEEVFTTNSPLVVNGVEADNYDNLENVLADDPDDCTDDLRGEMLEHEGVKGVFEHDKVKAQVERELLDHDFNVRVGDAKEDGEYVSSGVKSYP